MSLSFLSFFRPYALHQKIKTIYHFCHSTFRTEIRVPHILRRNHHHHRHPFPAENVNKQRESKKKAKQTLLVTGGLLHGMTLRTLGLENLLSGLLAPLRRLREGRHRRTSPATPKRRILESTHSQNTAHTTECAH
jgi:hypothetical protein